MDANSLLDALTIATSIISGLFIIENMLIWKYSWDVTFLWMKMGIRNLPGFIRWTAEGKWKFHLAEVDPLNPKKWTITYKGIGKEAKEIPFEVVKGSVGIGPGKVSLMLIADENTGAAGISLNNLLEGHAIGATPAHVSALEKARYAEGYMEGFTKSNPTGVWDWAAQNWQLIAIFFVLMVVGALTLWDKVYSSPAAWAEATKCQNDKAIIVGKLAQCGVDVSSILSPGTAQATTTTIRPIQSMAGAVVK